MLRSLSAESMLLEPFSVLPGSDFVEWTSVREDDKGVKVVQSPGGAGLAGYCASTS